MTDNVDNGGFLDKRNNIILISAILLTIGMIVGGYLLGNGLLRSKMADRSVTVRGLAERDVTADLATWTIAYSAQSTNLAEAQADIDADTAAIGKFFTELGFEADALRPPAAMVGRIGPTARPHFRTRHRLSLPPMEM